MTAEEAQSAVAKADVVWLSGGDTPTQFAYFKKYGLDTIIKEHQGVIIGMSAGTLNLTKTVICTLSCGHYKQEIYEGLGCVDISIEPHFVRDEVSNEVLELSKEYVIYGLCDDGIIVFEDGETQFIGEVYKISNGIVALIH